MIRGTLTLLNRSIRGDALKPEAHTIRLISIGILLIFLFVAQIWATEFSAPGIRFFHSMSYLGVALIALAGIGHFANSITEEKEEGTLGLLLLANISPLAILLGKSTNRLLSTLMIFAAQFPFALLAITLGGITISQIVTAYLTLAGFLFLIANLALLASVISRKSSEASALTVLFTFIALGFIPSLQHTVDQLELRGLLERNGPAATSVKRLYDFHLSTSVIQQIDSIFALEQDYQIFSRQIMFSLAVGLLCFSLAWLIFQRIIWAPEGIEPHRTTAASQNYRWSLFISRPWKNSLAWKDFYFVAGGTTLLAAKLLFFPIWIYFCFMYSFEIRRFAGTSGEQFCRDSLLIVLGIEMLMFASNFYHSERKLGTLSTLMMLPQSVSQISTRKLLGCLLATIPTIISIAATQIMISGVRGATYELIKPYTIFWIGLILILCHLTVLCSLIVKWGALPMAIGISLILGMILAPFIAGTMQLIADADQGALAEMSPLLYATAIVCVGINIEISRRIRMIAGG